MRYGVNLAADFHFMFSWSAAGAKAGKIYVVALSNIACCDCSNHTIEIPVVSTYQHFVATFFSCASRSFKTSFKTVTSRWSNSTKSAASAKCSSCQNKSCCQTGHRVQVSFPSDDVPPGRLHDFCQSPRINYEGISRVLGVLR